MYRAWEAAAAHFPASKLASGGGPTGEKDEEVLAHLLVLGIGVEGVGASGATERGGGRRSG